MLDTHCTNAKLRRLSRLVARRYDGALAASGLKSTQLALLTELARAGAPVQPGALAKHMAMDASTLTRNLKPLARAGWIETGPGDDGRTRQVALTRDGEAAAADAQAAWSGAQANLRKSLGPKRHDRLNRMLDEVFKIINDTDPKGDRQ